MTCLFSKPRTGASYRGLRDARCVSHLIHNLLLTAVCCKAEVIMRTYDELVGRLTHLHAAS